MCAISLFFPEDLISTAILDGYEDKHNTKGTLVANGDDGGGIGASRIGEALQLAELV